MTKQTMYNADGSIIYDYRYENEYNSSGNLTKQVTYNNGSFDNRTEYEYNSSGKQIKFVRYKADGSIDERTEFEYNSSGYVTKRISYKADGSISGGYEYEYDSSGKNLIKYVNFYYSEGSKRIGWWFEYENNSKGDRIKQVQYNADESINGKSEYTYTYITISLWSSNGRLKQQLSK